MRDQKAFHTSSSSYYRFLNSHLISNLFVLHQFLKRLMFESEAWVFGMCILWMHSWFLKNKLQQYLQFHFMWKYLWEIDTFDFSPNALLKFSVWSITWFFQTEVYLVSCNERISSFSHWSLICVTEHHQVYNSGKANYNCTHFMFILALSVQSL